MEANVDNRKSRIERRLDKRRFGDASRPAFTASNIHYEIADRVHAISHGGVGAFHLLAQRTCTWSASRPNPSSQRKTSPMVCLPTSAASVPILATSEPSPIGSRSVASARSPSWNGPDPRTHGCLIENNSPPFQGLAAGSGQSVRVRQLWRSSAQLRPHWLARFRGWHQLADDRPQVQAGDRGHQFDRLTASGSSRTGRMLPLAGVSLTPRRTPRWGWLYWCCPPRDKKNLPSRKRPLITDNQTFRAKSGWYWHIGAWQRVTEFLDSPGVALQTHHERVAGLNCLAVAELVPRQRRGEGGVAAFRRLLPPYG
jgi:hypothetical protein